MTEKIKFNQSDLIAFSLEVKSLRQSVLSSISYADIRFLFRVIWINRLFTIVGYALAWIIPNPVSMFCISQGIFGRWMVAHHVLHGGYDRVPNVPKRYHSTNFAKGWRRFLDWFDWLYPPAWKVEHNILHHCNTGAELDPDLVILNSNYLRRRSWPWWVKRLFILAYASVWKPVYYSPALFKALREKKLYRRHFKPSGLVQSSTKDQHASLLYSYLPYTIVSFLVIPFLFYPLGLFAVLSVLINKIGAEILTNWHSFLTITSNHAGKDLLLYDKPYTQDPRYYALQTLTTTNFKTGRIKDYFQGWLNYQIEHHLFSDIPMSKYPAVAKEIKALCKKYNIPYREDSILTRLKLSVNIMIGKESQTKYAL